MYAKFLHTLKVTNPLYMDPKSDLIIAKLSENPRVWRFFIVLQLTCRLTMTEHQNKQSLTQGLSLLLMTKVPKSKKSPPLSHFKAYLEARVPAGLPAVGMGFWDQHGGYHEGDDEGREVCPLHDVVCSVFFLLRVFAIW